MITVRLKNWDIKGAFRSPLLLHHSLPPNQFILLHPSNITRLVPHNTHLPVNFASATVNFRLNLSPWLLLLSLSLPASSDLPSKSANLSKISISARYVQHGNKVPSRRSVSTASFQFSHCLTFVSRFPLALVDKRQRFQIPGIPPYRSCSILWQAQ